MLARRLRPVMTAPAAASTARLPPLLLALGLPLAPVLPLPLLALRLRLPRAAGLLVLLAIVLPLRLLMPRRAASAASLSSRPG